MPRPRFHSLAPEVRQKILDVAAQAFAEQGFHEASYNGIIQAAGMSKGSFYYYFDDKMDLFAFTVQQAMEEAAEGLGGLWDAHDDGRDFWVQVLDLCEQLFQAAMRHPRVVLLAKAGVGVWDNPRLRALTEGGNERMAAILAVGQAHGAVRTDLPMALLVALCMGLGESMDRFTLATMPADAKGLPEVDPAYLEMSVDLFRRLLQP